MLKLPSWVTPSCIFNNTTSLPLLLIQSLESSGSLRTLASKDETVSDAVHRAQSYLLVCAVVNKTMAYAIGPHLLEKNTEDDRESRRRSSAGFDTGANADEENGQNSNDEMTSLLPQSAQEVSSKTDLRIKYVMSRLSARLPDKLKEELLSFESPFVKDAMLGVTIGAIIGLVPTLHKAFFRPSYKGGIFNAWLTSSVNNIGQLFTSLQMFTVGSRLGVSFEKIKTSRLSGSTPILALTTIFLVRFVVWPA